MKHKYVTDIQGGTGRLVKPNLGRSTTYLNNLKENNFTGVF